MIASIAISALSLVSGIESKKEADVIVYGST